MRDNGKQTLSLRHRRSDGRNLAGVGDPSIERRNHLHLASAPWTHFPRNTQALLELALWRQFGRKVQGPLLLFQKRNSFLLRRSGFRRNFTCVRVDRYWAKLVRVLNVWSPEVYRERILAWLLRLEINTEDPRSGRPVCSEALDDGAVSLQINANRSLC